MGPIRTRHWLLALAAAALAATVSFVVWQRSRALTVEGLIDHLPPAEAAVLHIDVAALRRAGVLEMIAGSPAAEESEYKTFVTQSGFNYREHLDLVIGSFRDDQAYLLLRGRFDWKALEAYAQRQGGSCEGGFCRMPASIPGRHLSFFRLRQDVLAFSSGPNPWGAASLRNSNRTRPRFAVPNQPFWLYLPGSAFRSSGELPSGTRLFAKSLEEADSVMFWVGVSGVRFAAQIEATCRTEEAAVILKAQLEKVTDVLKKLISRSGVQPNPRDLSGVLTQGSFRREGRTVIGTWPLEKVFLEAVLGGV